MFLFGDSLRKRESFPITLLLGVSVVLRIGLALVIWKIQGPAGFVTSDSLEYLAAARSLLHGSFSSLTGPEILRTPGYPLILMPVVLFQRFEIFALLENFLLASFSVWLVWKITLRVIGNSHAALWAALLFSFEPLQMESSELVMTETLFCALLLVFVWFLVSFLELPSWQNLLGAALPLSLAVYTRPVALYLPIWLLPLLLFFPATLSRRQRVARAIAFPVVVAAALVPWVVRNDLVARYRGFSTVADDYIYSFCAAAIEAKVENKPFSQVMTDRGAEDENVYFQLHPEQRNWSQQRVFDFRRKDALQIISRHPWYFLYFQIKGWLSVTFNPSAAQALKLIGLYPQHSALLDTESDKGFLHAFLWLVSRSPATAVIVVLLELQLLIYYFLTLWGFRSLPGNVGLLFFSLALYFIFVSGSPPTESRYRMPVMPLVCISAGIAMSKLQDNGWKIAGSHKNSKVLA